jgi:selenocysteine-specific elongation factor
VLRSYSPMHVLGGGVVLDPRALKHRRTEKGVTERLERALAGSPEDIVLDALTMAETGLIKPQIVQKTGLIEKDVSDSLKSLVSEGLALEQGGRFLARSSYEMLAARLRSALETYHTANPMKPGAPKEEMRAQLGPRVDQKGFQAILALMATGGQLTISEATIRLPGHTPTLSPKQKELADTIERAFAQAGANPPFASDTDQRYGPDGRSIIAMLIERGDLVRVAPEVVFHKQALDEIEASLRAYLGEHGQITVAQFRDVIGSSRKYVVPLVEYFDDAKVTRRVGDQRVLGTR